MTKEEAIKIIKDWKGFLNSSLEEALKILIPELKESEDEFTRQEMIVMIRSISSDCQFAIYLTNDQKQRYLAWLEKQKDTSKAIEAVDKIDKYIDEHLANAHDMKDSNPDKKYYRGWDDALGKMSGILQDVYSEEKQKEQKPASTPERIRPKFAVGDTICHPMRCDHTVQEIYVRCADPVYVCVNEEGLESHVSFSEQNEWKRKEQKPFNVCEQCPYYKDCPDYNEQKPAEWSEEDDWKRKELIQYLEEKGDYRTVWMTWLKSLPEKIK